MSILGGYSQEIYFRQRQEDDNHIVLNDNQSGKISQSYLITNVNLTAKDTLLPEKVFSMSLMSLCHKPFIYEG